MVELNGKSIVESLDIPVRGEYDIVVAGGGMAGIMAALNAARSGAHVALVEPNTFLGGAMLSTSGVWDDCPGGYKEDTPAGEILSRLVSYGGSPGIYEEYTHGDREWLPYVLMEMAGESRVRLYLNSSAVSLIKEDNTVTGLIITGKFGTEALLAGEVIDAPGNGILALQAGMHALEHGVMQAKAAIGLGGVDLERTLEYVSKEGLLKRICRAENNENRPIIRLCFKLPFSADEILPELCITSNLPGRVNQLEGVTVQIKNNDAQQKGLACVRLSKASLRLVALLKENIPGFEDSFLDWTTSSPAFDFGRRFVKELPLSGLIVTGRAVLQDTRNCLRSGQRAGENAAARVRRHTAL